MENLKIVEILTPYFDNKDIDSLILCDDGNVFYKEGKHYAEFHCKNIKTKSQVVTRDYFNDLKNPKKEIKQKVDKPKTDK